MHLIHIHNAIPTHTSPLTGNRTGEKVVDPELHSSTSASPRSEAFPPSARIHLDYLGYHARYDIDSRCQVRASNLTQIEVDDIVK